MQHRIVQNPFRIHGIVEGDFFTDRTSEIARFSRTLQEPTAKLLVSGYRRMGKSSTLARAVAEVNAAGGLAIMADFSTASTVTDMASNLLAAAGKMLGRRWTSLISDLSGRFQASLKVTLDPATGLMLPSLDVGLRQETLATQQATLAHVLDTLDALAAARQANLGIVLDEFQEITRFSAGPDGTSGGTGERRRGQDRVTDNRQDQPEWHLRGVIQRHQHLSYVLAGSRPTLLAAMVGRSGAFYNMLDRHAFGPIEREHMSEWIDQRLRLAALQPLEAGRLCVEWGGPRTRDIVRLARKCVDHAAPGAIIDAAAVAAAYSEIVDEEDEAIQTRWQRLSSQQQNALRAVAAEPIGLTTKEVRRRFSLDASTTANTLKTLVQAGDLVRSTYGSRHAFDDPFVRGWVIKKTLPDLGIRDKPITYVATPSSEYEQ